MLDAYFAAEQDRTAQGLPPLPLTAAQVAELVAALPNLSPQAAAPWLALLTNRVPPGVDAAAYVKAAFLTAVAKGEIACPALAPLQAVRLLGTMQGGYNVAPLIAFLELPDLAAAAAQELAHTLLIYDFFHDVVDKAKSNPFAKQVLTSWASGEWLSTRPAFPKTVRLRVLRVADEINTDDLSPAQDAWSRPDIPLHALAMLKSKLPEALEKIKQFKAMPEALPIAFVGDVVGTGSSRKSAINSIQWHLGEDIPFVPNKKRGGVILGGKIAPIFFNTAEDSGALPIECDVNALTMGQVIILDIEKGEIRDEAGRVISTFQLQPSTLLQEYQAGGRILLMIGRALSDRAAEALGVPPAAIFIRPQAPTATTQGFTLAQKMVGRACGVEGVLPGSYCEPKVSSVGSQDTTGAMTRDELKDLACLGFSADLVMQSFCHTAAYPKPVDIALQHELPEFMISRGGISLRPGDGVIHSWLNRMILPDTVGTGGDSHTRFPIGISFPAGSGLVALAAALGVMPLDMPESVRVRFVGKRQPGITLRDLVHAIPYVALKQGLLTLPKKGKVNIFNGRILEIEGLPDLKVEQAFEFSDASAERSANGCTVLLDQAPIAEFLTSNITLLKAMIAEGYADARSLARRIAAMEAWLNKPELLHPDTQAKYAFDLEINMDEITEPLLACPNDPDDIRPLSEVAGTPIDEVFIGSCMTNIGHYRAAAKVLAQQQSAVPTRLWVAPPTRLDEAQLKEEGFYSIFGQAGARMELPGCSLCMGNQARVADGASVVSTSTRNFPNRLGKDANVYLASAEVSALAARLGRLPTPAEYQAAMQDIDLQASDIYRYLNFDQLLRYQRLAAKGQAKVLEIKSV
jgi:aconitate hydratase 2/2-methylisocitrate dehydratase